MMTMIMIKKKFMIRNRGKMRLDAISSDREKDHGVTDEGEKDSDDGDNDDDNDDDNGNNDDNDVGPC